MISFNVDRNHSQGLLPIFFLLLCFFSFSDHLSAQSLKLKWGKLSNEEIALQQYQPDSSAAAIILADKGTLFTTSLSSITCKRHTRIKILKSKGVDHANIVIPFFRYKGQESISNLRAQTINIINGKTVKTSLDKKEFFEVQLSENHAEMRFTLPAVAQGSIIEYSYTLHSLDQFNLQDWDFQNEIPTLKSELTTKITGRSSYQVILQGPRLRQKYVDRVVNTWYLDSLPAIRGEPFCPNPDIYTEKVRFQIAEYWGHKNGRNQYISIMNDWEGFTKDLLENKDFTLILKKGKRLKKETDALIKNGEKPLSKMKSIYQYVTRTLKWDENYRIFPTQNIGELSDSRSGGSCEVNHFLIAMLRNAGLDAHPALVATKRYGRASQSYPLLSQFNHLIAYVRIADQDYFLDATNPYRPYNLVAPEDLNPAAFVLDEKEPRWVDVPTPKKNQILTLVNFQFGQSDTIHYKFISEYKGYEACNKRESIQQEYHLSSYMQDLIAEQNEELQLDSIFATNFQAYDKPLRITSHFTSNQARMGNGSLLYFNPFLNLIEHQNPFNQKVRYLPVDLYYPSQKIYILNADISDDYEMVELPQSAHFELPNNKGYLKYFSQYEQGNLQIRLEFVLKESLFYPSEYHLLTTLFDLLIEKTQEPVVFKRR